VKIAFAANASLGFVLVAILNLPRSSSSDPMNHPSWPAVSPNCSIGSPDDVFSINRVVDAVLLDVMDSRYSGVEPPIPMFADKKLISSGAAVESNSILPAAEPNPMNDPSATTTSPVNVISPEFASPMSIAAPLAPVMSPPETVRSSVTVRLLENKPDPATSSLTVGLVVPMPMFPVEEAIVKMSFAAKPLRVEVEIRNLPMSLLSTPRSQPGVKVSCAPNTKVPAMEKPRSYSLTLSLPPPITYIFVPSGLKKISAGSDSSLAILKF